jgi:diguanylate cyclase (GGDEF)-like protein
MKESLTLTESIKNRLNDVDLELKTLIEQLLLDYEKKSSRIDKIIEQSDKQQFELVKLNEKLKIASETDHLTSLLSRLKCEEILINFINNQNSFSVMLINIDDFKSINEKFDILVANQFLIQLSKVIKKNINQKSSLGRWTGNTFIVLDKNLTSDEMIEIAEEVCDGVENYFFDKIGKATVSIGVSTIASHSNLIDAVKSFEGALKRAKLGGKNQVSI